MYKLPDYEPLIQHTEDASVRYYFKMITGIQPGSIETIFDGNKYIPKQTNMDNSIKLQLSNKKIFKLFVDFNVETMKRSGTGEFFYAPLILQHESKRQILNTYYLKKYGVNRYNFYTDGPCLYWAGDIDRDGYLDLILNLYDDGHHAGITFFMSSQAGYNKLIKKVFEDYDHSE